MLLLSLVSSLLPKHRLSKRFVVIGEAGDGVRSIDMVLSGVNVFDRPIEHLNLKA